jgi:CBS domain-containing protein
MAHVHVTPTAVSRLHGTVGDVLALKGTQVYAIAPESTVYDAIEQLNERRIGALLVMTGEALDGIVSERDYARKIALQNRSSKDTRVADIMTPAERLHTVSPETSIAACLELVTRAEVRHLPVLRDGHLMGLVSIGDLVRTVVEQQDETIRELSAYIGNAYPD